ncbi:hypothetical protein EON63_19140 [archaeon]|nr:MAG: hypothetical protein EON63_19140 [archaeon]
MHVQTLIHTHIHALLLGVTASLAHDLIMTPFDVCKQRMQLGYHQSMVHCLRHIVRTEGYRALYVSLPMTSKYMGMVMGMCTFVMSVFVLFTTVSLPTLSI